MTKHNEDNNVSFSRHSIYATQGLLKITAINLTRGRPSRFYDCHGWRKCWSRWERLQ